MVKSVKLIALINLTYIVILLHPPPLVQVSHHTIFGSVESKYRFATTFLICAQTRCRHVVLFSKLSVNRTMFIHNKVIVYLLISYVEAMKGSFTLIFFNFILKVLYKLSCLLRSQAELLFLLWLAFFNILYIRLNWTFVVLLYILLALVLFSSCRKRLYHQSITFHCLAANHSARVKLSSCSNRLTACPMD